MRAKKLSLLKRILALFCCTVLLSSSVFSSYSITVYAADDDYDLKDCVEDILGIVLLVGGIISIPASGGLTALGAVGIAQGLLQGSDSVVNIYNYVTDNGDGTYTIDPTFIQAAMDAAEQLEEQGFTDFDVQQQGEGYFQIYKWTVTNTFTQNFNGTVYPGRCHVYNRSCELAARVAGFNEVLSGSSSDGIPYTNYYHNVYQYKSGSVSFVAAPGKYSYNTFNGEQVVTNCSASLSDSLFLDGVNRYGGSSSFGGNFPIFSTRDAMNDYLRSGSGYKDAINYRAQPIFRRHSSYTPIYSGGSVTISRTVIDNINNTITEVDSRESLTDDEKIEILQQYIFTGKLEGGTVGGNTDYEDNKDLPAGSDLTDTNSWLKKIYLKVCQIFDRMNTAVGDAGSAAMARIQEQLDEIVEQLKKIKRWTAVDTVIDGVDAIADWLDLILGVLKDAKEGAGSAVAAIAGSLGDSVDSMSGKFPFSIPWDILFFVSVLSAEPQVPYFEIPFNIELSALDITIDYTMELDFSQFQWLSDLSRLLLSMTYAVGLMKMTFNVTTMGKEE